MTEACPEGSSRGASIQVTWPSPPPDQGILQVVWLEIASEHTRYKPLSKGLRPVNGERMGEAYADRP